jgi:hypothetical protein
MLLAAGALLEEADPGHLCKFAGASTAAIRALRERGIVVRELVDVNGDGGTPMHLAACRTRDVAILDMLVNDCGVDLEARDQFGETCVYGAVRDSNVRALRWLIEAGADVNCVSDHDDSTPLLANYDYDCTTILLAAGADVEACDARGETALHWVAREMAGARLAHALLAGGADLDGTFHGTAARTKLARLGWTLNPDQVEVARRDIAKTRLDFVRHRALQVCIGLQSLELDALQLCEILLFACGPVAPLVPFHSWWKIATTVKHFRTH